MTTSCRKCVADLDCPGACHELEGTCTTAAETIYVAPTGSDNLTCGELAPCASIDGAAKLATASRKLVRVEDGTYVEALSIDRDAIISGTDVGVGGAIVQPPASSSGVQLNGQHTVVFEGITIVGTNNDAVVNRGALTLSHVLIRNAQRHGIDNRGGTLTVRDSRIVDSANAGINGNATLDVKRTEILRNSEVTASTGLGPAPGSDQWSPGPCCGPTTSLGGGP